MGFVYPEVLWAFLLLLPILIAWTFVSRLREKKLTQFTVKENWGVLNDQVSKRARFHKGLLILIALSLSIVAAARPYWGEREIEVPKRGTNILFAIDVSDSMRADDIGANAGTIQLRREGANVVSRLDAAKTLVRQILAELPGQRIGIMPFAGDAFLQCPPTTDYGLLYDVARQVDFDSIGDPGSDLNRVIDQAIETFERLQVGTRVLVIISDGEDHSDAIQEAANKALENNIRVYTLGVGSLDGVPLRMSDGSIKEDRQGLKVLSRLVPDALRTLSDTTGGKTYIAGGSGMIDPTGLINDLAGLQKQDFGEERRVVRDERYQWPLGLAMLILMLEMVIHDRKRIKVAKGRHRGFDKQKKGATT